jgi:HAE1 family hydrophobic/amphiphilic exporter-1
MGVVVIGGLTLSTVLTLVIVPVMYTIFDDIADFFKRKFTKNKVTPESI